jgi:phosphatidylglycerophosphatase A
MSQTRDGGLTAAPAGAWRRWIVTVGGSGMSPAAPGTAGSLATTILLGIVLFVLERSHATHLQYAWCAALVLGILLFGALCVVLGPWTVQYYGRKDPGSCVLDEAAGICLTALVVPIYPQGRGYWTLLAVFASFRLFDIVKLPPARQLERLPYGWGILMDDLAAAIYANVVCQILFRWLFT